MGEHHTATGPGEGGAKAVVEERTARAPRSQSTLMPRAAEVPALRDMRTAMPYRVMVANLRCATSTSIGDNKDI